MEIRREENMPVQGAIAYQLLKLIYERGTITTTDAYFELGNLFKISNEMKNIKYSSGENVWEARVRAAKNNALKNPGLLINHNNKNGIWEITENGRSEFKKLKANGKTVLE